eukprot:1189723-Prorocentrum_minimum.AAC.3
MLRLHSARSFACKKTNRPTNLHPHLRTPLGGDAPEEAGRGGEGAERQEGRRGGRAARGGAAHPAGPQGGGVHQGNPSPNPKP